MCETGYVKGIQMGKVNKEEIIQWAGEIASLGLEWTKISKRIRERGENIECWEVIGEEKLPLLLEKLKKVPVPKEKLCESFMKDCEEALGRLIEAREIDAKYVSEPGTPWVPRMTVLFAVDSGPFHFLPLCLDTLGKKYQIRPFINRESLKRRSLQIR